MATTPTRAIGLVVTLIALGIGAFVLVKQNKPAADAVQVEAASGADETEKPSGKVPYSPVTLLDNGVPPGEVFLEEPRTDAWADQVEAVIGSAMQADLDATVPDAHVALTCRTLSCLVGIDAPEEKRANARAVTQLVMLAPYQVDLPPEEDGTVRWLFFSEPRMGDADHFIGWYKKIRKARLQQIRDGKQENPFPVELDDIPKE